MSRLIKVKASFRVASVFSFSFMLLF